MILVRPLGYGVRVWDRELKKRRWLGTYPTLGEARAVEREAVPVKKRDETEDERFWGKVVKTDGCWLWTDTPNDRGYGVIRIGGRYRKAHGWAYERLVGPIPEGLCLDHLCRNRICVNPAHLEPVTLAENTRRSWKARRAGA